MAPAPRWSLVALLLATAAAVGPAASAHPESAAPSLRPDVVAAWHEPAAVEPHTQWHGYLRLEPSTNVTAAAYQICRVGQTCFAPPAPAHRLENGTWAFDTADYLANGRPVDYGAGWRLGVKWWLTEARPEGNATVEFPQGPDVTSDACSGDAALGCAESHYLAFEVAAAGKGAPAPAAGWAALGLAALAAAARRRA